MSDNISDNISYHTKFHMDNKQISTMIITNCNIFETFPRGYPFITLINESILDQDEIDRHLVTGIGVLNNIANRILKNKTNNRIKIDCDKDFNRIFKPQMIGQKYDHTEINHMIGQKYDRTEINHMIGKSLLFISSKINMICTFFFPSNQPDDLPDNLPDRLPDKLSKEILAGLDKLFKDDQPVKKYISCDGKNIDRIKSWQQYTGLPKIEKNMSQKDFDCLIYCGIFYNYFLLQSIESSIYSIR